MLDSDLPAGAVVLQPTRTLCPVCLQTVEGRSYLHEGKVWLGRRCPTHGVATALIAADRASWWGRGEVPHPPPASACATGPAHPSCVVLLELTDACNLACPACYARSPAGRHRPLEELKAALTRFVRERGPVDVLQLSGGEPTLHPDFFAILDFARRAPFGHVMINTNGLRLAEDPELARQIAARRPRVELYLQMDGLDAASHVALRGKDLLDVKRRALEAAVAADLPVTLVVTVVKGVNEQELGELLRLGLSLPQVRGISLQPATGAGRFELPLDPRDRATAGDVFAWIEAQGGVLEARDFQPLPCSNPNCCQFSFLRRDKYHAPAPLLRLVDLARHLGQVEDRIAFQAGDAVECCGVKLAPEEAFRVVVKPFMDAWTFDWDRVDECCTHVLTREGEAVSFCKYNVLMR